MEVNAIYKYAPAAAQKVRLVADLVRGKSAENATQILKFCNKKAAALVKRTLDSAIANAEHNNGADIDDLVVAIIEVNEGPMLKRFQARARGRGNRILKRSCHIKITVSDLAGD